MNWINQVNVPIHLVSKSKIATWIYLALTVFVFLFTCYKDWIVFQGQVDYSYFYAALLAIFSFFIIVFNLNNSLRSNIVLLTTSLLFCFYILELVIYANSALFFNDRYRAAESYNVEFDKRSVLEVIDDLKGKNIDSVPFYPAMRTIKGIDIINGDNFTIGGVSNITTVGSNESGEYGIYTSDRYGFNNPDGQWEGEIGVAVIGDSFVHGATVNVGEDISSNIRGSDNVVNLGVGGHGPLLELATLVEYAKPYKVKKLIWVYYEGNDLSDLSIERQKPLLMKYLDRSFSQDLLAKKNKIDDYLVKQIEVAGTRAEKFQEQQVRGIVFLWHVRFFLKKLLANKFQNERENNFKTIYGQNISLFLRIILQAKKEVELWGGEFYFVYLPEYSRYKNISNHDAYKEKAKLINLIKAVNIPVIDIHKEVFLNHPTPLLIFPFGLSGHYTEKGYKEVAKKIVTGVENTMSSR